MKSACVLLLTAGLVSAVTIPAQLAERGTLIQSLAGQGSVFRRAQEAAQASAADSQKEAESADARKKTEEEKKKGEAKNQADKNKENQADKNKEIKKKEAAEGNEAEKNQQKEGNKAQSEERQQNATEGQREQRQGEQRQGEQRQGEQRQQQEENRRVNNNQNDRENNNNNNRENNNREDENNINQLNNQFNDQKLQQLLAAQINQMALGYNQILGNSLSVANVANFGIGQQVGLLVALNCIGLMSALPIQGINNQVLLASLGNGFALNGIDVNGLNLPNGGLAGIGNINLNNLAGINGLAVI